MDNMRKYLNILNENSEKVISEKKKRFLNTNDRVFFDRQNKSLQEIAASIISDANRLVGTLKKKRKVDAVHVQELEEIANRLSEITEELYSTDSYRESQE